tara:strand:+ start:207 stop:407 length:201 start_codon:yes stop_codon:yes gene_type:complete
MNQELKRLTEAKQQWENDIKMYNNFLKNKSQTFEGKYGAKEYISMAENRISDINKKLKELEKKQKR